MDISAIAIAIDGSIQQRTENATKNEVSAHVRRTLKFGTSTHVVLDIDDGSDFLREATEGALDQFFA